MTEATICGRCQTPTKTVKAGRTKSGTQMLKCRNCGYRFVAERVQERYSQDVKQRAVELHDADYSNREIAFMLHVNRQTVANWLKTAESFNNARLDMAIRENSDHWPRRRRHPNPRS
jgi:transposase-like protein